MDLPFFHIGIRLSFRYVYGNKFILTDYLVILYEGFTSPEIPILLLADYLVILYEDSTLSEIPILLLADYLVILYEDSVALEMLTLM